MSGLTKEEIMKHYAGDFEAQAIERVAHRRLHVPLVITEPDPTWPTRFAEYRDLISGALGDFALSINHVGSTSIPNLPAKPVIDIDLVVRDLSDEKYYVPRLEAVGFLLLLREPKWHGHRYFVHDKEGMYPVNLHVFGEYCAEVERHRIFREWLIKTPDDFKRYEEIKRQSAKETNDLGGDVDDYNARKEATIQVILDRAFAEIWPGSIAGKVVEG